MVDLTSSTACWSLWLVIAVFIVVPVRTENTELKYRIVPDTPPPEGLISSMLLLDGGRLLLSHPYMNQLRLVNLQNPNTTQSSLQLPESPLYLSRFSDHKILVAPFLLGTKKTLWIVNISGDVLEVEREVTPEKLDMYNTVCAGPDDTFFASSQPVPNQRASVDQLDLQGKVLRTVFPATTDEFVAVVLLRHHGDNLYIFNYNSQVAVLNLATSQVTSTIGQTDPSTLSSWMRVYDLDFDHEGDAYLCVQAVGLCGDARSCLVRITPTGQVNVLTSFLSHPSQVLACYDVIPTANQLLVNWLGFDPDSTTSHSEITVQSLPL